MEYLKALHHGALGAVTTTGGITLVQSLIARHPQPPSQFGLSAGAFVGIFRLGECYERTAGKQANSPRAAFAAGLLGMHLLPERRRGVILSYAMLEALVTLAKMKSNLADIKLIELPLGALACSRIIYTWIYNSDLFAPSQLAVLDGLCVIPPSTLARMREEFSSGKLVSRCDIFHRGQTCTEYHVQYLRDGYLKSMRVFIPIYLVSAVVLRYKKWLYGPRPSVRELVGQYLRSCAYLTMGYQIPLFFACVSPIKNHRVSVIIGGFLTALALLVEHEKRRASVLKAIAMYSVCTTGTLITRRTQMRSATQRMWQDLLFAMAIAMILRRPEWQNRSLIQWLYGYDPTTRQCRESCEEDEAQCIRSAR